MYYSILKNTRFSRQNHSLINCSQQKPLDMKRNYLRLIQDYNYNKTALAALSAVTIAMTMPACSSEEEQEEITVSEHFERGVITNIKEVAKDDFKIVDEQISPDGKSYATVEYMDGKKDTLSYALLKDLVGKSTTDGNNATNHTITHVYHSAGIGSSLMTAIMFSQLGYMMGNMSSMNRAAYYQDPSVYERTSTYGQQAVSTRSYVSKDARTGRVVATSKTPPRGGITGSFSKPRSSSSS